MMTDYCYSEHNDLDKHVSYLRSQGMDPGAVVAQYLTFDYLDDDAERKDFYLAWIEIRPTQGSEEA